MQHSQLLGLSPLPIVDLDAIDVPQDGLWTGTASYCKRAFGKDGRCREHYARISELLDSSAATGPIQCPYGFATIPAKAGATRFALTSIIPYPRLGGDAERRMAKAFPSCKTPIDAIDRAVRSLCEIERRLYDIEIDAVRRHSMALHEIRKLNRSVKQTAERLCNQHDRRHAEAPPAELLQIWKSAEMMSAQFEIIELLANESLTTLPLNGQVELYRIVDKCVRIFRPAGNSDRIRLRSSDGFSGKISACDKTFPIIPTVLIENALKYSIAGTEIAVDVYTDHGSCVLCVSNIAARDEPLSEAVFEKGRRATSSGEGYGHGLYLAQLVARQHKTKIKAKSHPLADGQMRCQFIIKFEEAK